MKKLLCALITLVLTLAGAAFAEPAGGRLQLEYGLFSVELPADALPCPDTDAILSMFEYELTGIDTTLSINYAPLSEYEYTAGRYFDSRISLAFALSGGEYSESDIMEETLENGAQLKWQLMWGSSMHSLWFEVLTENYGYNMLISGPPTDAQDEMMLGIMRSFEYDAQLEKDLVELNQTDLGGGRFMSIDHGLVVTLNDSWYPIPIEYGLTYPGCVFVLTFEEGRHLIQLFGETLSEDYTVEYVLDAYMEGRKEDLGGEHVKYSEPYAVELENLGVEALVIEENNNVNMFNLAFRYGEKMYYGSFMWIVPDDATARPFMENAIKSLSVPE